MSGILNTRRTIATALMITVAATALAAPALAVDPTPEQSHLLLQSSDLPASYGKPTDASFTNVQSGGVLASACTTATFDSPATAKVKSTTAGGGTPPYGDSTVRILTKQTGNAIESLRIIEDDPKLPSAAVTARYEAKQDAIFTTLVSRYHD